jgi:hypothetical protein
MKMPKTTPEQNKALVLKAFDTLFNQRDYAAAERFWSSWSDWSHESVGDFVGTLYQNDG